MANKEELDNFLSYIRDSYGNHECPLKGALELIGGKWKLRIIAQLLKNEVVRFNELKREISGITNTMLSNSLHELERDELIARHQYDEMPVRVEYTLTERGNNLLPILYELSNWWRSYGN
jgi:DNA-binding HxlR family transcriptional regulator